jgi:light-regulated signal transduction histidine kinase (bacteriophytochrome)
VREYQAFGRRATDLLELEGRAWRPMPPPSPAGVMGDTDVFGRHLARVDQLERRVGELERDNRELAAFAADVAHDLRAPLQAVSGFTELLARREGAGLDETSQGFLGHILSATGAMKELVEAVLEHRQSSFGALSPTWVYGNDLVVAVLRRLQRDLDEAGAVVEVGDLPTVLADRIQLGRVFQNLIVNALRAAHPDRPPKIVVTGRRLAASWEFAVTDNGVGVRPEDRNRIFELFQRGPSDGMHSAGHGMGLTICRTIIERHGGRIGVERAPECGTRFSFTIPDRNGGTRPALGSGAMP